MHGEDFDKDRNLRPSSIARPWIFPTMHGYSVYSAFSRGSFGHQRRAVSCASCSSRSAGSACSLASSATRSVRRGGVRRLDGFACLDEQEMAEYGTRRTRTPARPRRARRVLVVLGRLRSESANVPPFDNAPHELRFGVVRSDGSEKPVATMLSRFADEQREVAVALPPPIADEREHYAGLPGKHRKRVSNVL